MNLTRFARVWTCRAINAWVFVLCLYVIIRFPWWLDEHVFSRLNEALGIVP